MKTAEEIQDEYAESLGYDNFYCLIKDDVRAIDTHVRKVQLIYGIQVINLVASKCQVDFLSDVDVLKLKDHLK